MVHHPEPPFHIIILLLLALRVTIITGDLRMFCLLPVLGEQVM